ncbi:MAG: TRZ/ATZ family hydrolase [Pseudomonadota bacterium]
MKQRADFVIQPRYLVPIEPLGVAWEGKAVAVREGQIAAILDLAELGEWEWDECFDLSDHALLPGLVNAHGHSPMTLLRGFADDLALQPWLENHIWPAEAAHVDEDFVRDGSRLAIAEMLLSGTSCFSDMYLFPEVVAEQARITGIRCQLCSPIIDFPSAWAAGADDYLSKGLSLIDDLKNQTRISVVFGPHAPYSVSQSALEKVATYAAELDRGIQIHLHETEKELADSQQQFGRRPIQRLQELGLLGPRTQCVHMSQTNDADLETLQASGSSVIHCPESNMKLASGTCPTAKLLRHGIPVAIGTDGAASNNDLNMFGEMRSAALLAKQSDASAESLPAAMTLRMATLGGAEALGIDDLVGSIEPGKQADLLAVNLNSPHTQPVFDPVSQIVYACNGSEVSHLWVDGQALVRDKLLQSLDLNECLLRAQAWGRTIKSK